MTNEMTIKNMDMVSGGRLLSKVRPTEPLIQKSMPIDFSFIGKPGNDNEYIFGRLEEPLSLR
ncbi:MAG: hypothetical protein K5745_05125 [Saccharofermentans sp.]|nr:hypothetical protein [Saccharofermentans sp.]